eukprot:767273-Hanusia_phi.AAC.3
MVSSQPALVIRVSEFSSVSRGISSSQRRARLPTLRLSDSQRNYLDRANRDGALASSRAAVCLVKSDGADCLENVLRAKMKYVERGQAKGL